MDVKIKDQDENKKKIEIGDLIIFKHSHSNETVHIITKNEINGEKGLLGISLNGHNWSSDPQAGVDEGSAVLYKKEDWELVLQPKKKG